MAYKFGFWEKNFGEHVSFWRVTIYGWNAMHVAINIRFKTGYLCFHPTIKCFGKWWPWYLYFSKDGTPHNCKFAYGSTYR